MNKLQRPLMLLPSIASRGIHVTSAASKNHLRAGVFKVSKDQSTPLTYEEAKAPHYIGVQKSWLTWNTSNLIGENRQAETLAEDAFIRKFLSGTWPSMLLAEVVIKRRFNMVVIAGIVKRPRYVNETYFLIGYTEEMLSLLLKCPVKLEFQTVLHHKSLEFKYI